jgi:hypothetical protein
VSGIRVWSYYVGIDYGFLEPGEGGKEVEPFPNSRRIEQGIMRKLFFSRLHTWTGHIKSIM